MQGTRWRRFVSTRMLGFETLLRLFAAGPHLYIRKISVQMCVVWYNECMNENHQEVIDLFQPEISGDFAKIWLDDFVIDASFTLEDLLKFGMKRECGVVGMRKGLNGWDDVCFVGEVEKILDLGVEYLNGEIDIPQD